MHGVRALLILAVAAALVAAAGTEDRAAPAGPACTSAKVGGKRVCLTTGAKCSAKYASVYKAHGFQCKKGRLAKIPKPKPTTPAIGTVVAKIPLADSGWMLAAGDGSVWVAALNSDVLRVDPEKAGVTATIPSAPDQEFASWITVGDGSLWISNWTDSTVWRVDTATNVRTATIPVPTAPQGVSVGPSGVWVASHRGRPTGSLTRIDPATNTVSLSVPAGAAQDCCGPEGIAATSTAVWSTVPNLNAIVRLDPVTGTVVASIPATDVCGGVVPTDDAVWVVGCSNNVYRINPSTNTMAARILASGTVTDVAVGFGAVWALAHSLDPLSTAGTLVRIDPATNRVVGTLAVADAYGLCVLGDSVYVGSGHTLLRIRPS